MTVKELLERLQCCNPDSEVIISIRQNEQGNAMFGTSCGLSDVFTVPNQHPVLITDATMEDLR